MRLFEWSKRRQPRCPKCDSDKISLKIRYVNVTAKAPVRGGKARLDKLVYDGERKRNFECEDCGQVFEVNGSGM